MPTNIQEFNLNEAANKFNFTNELLTIPLSGNILKRFKISVDAEAEEMIAIV